MAMDKAKLISYAKKISAFYLHSKRMPTYSEMLDIFKLSSKNAVFKRINALIKEGFLEKDAKGRILPKRIARPLPLAGFVQAGFPSPAEEELQDLMSLEEYLVSNPKATYLLKIEGDSMIDAGIHPGDIVLVQKNLDPKTGDIVVAQVDSEWTLKYFEKKKNKVSLRAANEKYPTIAPKQELTVAGVVIANVRKYK